MKVLTRIPYDLKNDPYPPLLSKNGLKAIFFTLSPRKIRHHFMATQQSIIFNPDPSGNSSSFAYPSNPSLIAGLIVSLILITVNLPRNNPKTVLGWIPSIRQSRGCKVTIFGAY